jgi:sialidase-1
MEESLMLKLLSLVLLAVLISGTPAASAQSSTNGRAVHQTRIFESGQGGYDTYRIPALAVTKNGTLLAFCEGRRNSRSDSGDIDLLLRRSIDNGRIWEPVQVVVDDGANTCGNPCPIVDVRTGTILLLITKNNGSEDQDQIMRGEAAPRTAWLTTSRDDGLTWSAPKDISGQARKPDWRWYATGPCHGIQLQDGRLAAPCDHATGPEDEDMHSHVIFSDDGGASWKIGGVQEGRTDESTVLELADGALYLNMRNYHGTNQRAYSISHDKGLTWSPLAEDNALVEPVCQASVLRLSTEKGRGKNRVLFSNPASTRREKLAVRLSYDECKTWPVAKTLWDGPAAYSDLVVTADGMIGCLFECGEKSPYETITFALFTLEWLTDGIDRL